MAYERMNPGVFELVGEMSTAVRSDLTTVLDGMILRVVLCIVDM